MRIVGFSSSKVIVRIFTKVSTSPRKIDVQPAMIIDSATTSTTITLNQLAATEKNVRVCVNVKVMKQFDKVEIKPEK